MVLDPGLPPNPLNAYPHSAPGTPALLTTRDVLRFATINGAKGACGSTSTRPGSLTPRKEAEDPP